MSAPSMWSRTTEARGIAGRLLRFLCEDCRQLGFPTLYLVTDHTSFYERYGWRFLCMVQEEGGGQTRLYVHHARR